MVTMATERRFINEREAAVEFDGRWLLLDKRDFPPSAEAFPIEKKLFGY